MPLPDIPLTILQEKNQLATSEQFIWLYEIEVPSASPTVYRLTRQPAAVEFEGNTFSPFPIGHDTIRRDQDGDLPSTSVTASNISREIIATLELYDGLVGQPVRIILTHSLLTGANQLIGEEQFEVMSSTATADAVTLTLGSANLFDSMVPKSRMTRFHCRHQYRGAACGYSLDPTSPHFISACDKTLEGLNGCTVHGDSYTSAGLTPIHPERFGGFPGIPTPTTGGTI
jgi:lambda family phage minor tail protein L